MDGILVMFGENDGILVMFWEKDGILADRTEANAGFF
jgi:hypothetical protein